MTVRHGDGSPTPSHYTQWDGTGHQTMAGDARPWRSKMLDALSVALSGAYVSRNTSDSCTYFAFNSTYNATFMSADVLYFNLPLDYEKDLSASIYPAIQWWQEKNYVPNFLFEYRWQPNLGTKVTSWTKLTCRNVVATYASGTINQVCYSAAITPPAGSALSDVLQLRLYRDTGNASSQFSGACPYNTGGNASASLIAVGAHFMLNSLGATDEYTK